MNTITMIIFVIYFLNIESIFDVNTKIRVLILTILDLRWLFLKYLLNLTPVFCV